METKQAKTFEECCNEVAKKQYSKEWVYLNLSQRDTIYKFVCELYNQETAAERDRLKAKSDLLLKWQASAELEISSLKEENERLKALEKKAINLLTDRELEVHSLEHLNSEMLKYLEYEKNVRRVTDPELLELIIKANQQKEKP